MQLVERLLGERPDQRKEFFRRLPPVKITSSTEPESSATIFTALVMIVRF